MAAWLIVLVIGLPWLGSLVVWRAGDRREQMQHRLAAAFSLAAGAAALLLLAFISHRPAIRLPVGGLFGDLIFIPDGLGVFLAVIATVVGSLAVIFSAGYMKHEAQLGRYYSLVLLFIGAMAGLVLTGSFLFLFIFWEITALCSYALISFYNDDPKAVRAGVKALILTQLGGVGLLVGALVAYASLGSLETSVFLERASELPPALLALVAFGFLVAASAKSAQAPFHSWLPDAMEAPTPVSALIHAATMVNAGVYLLARFYPAFAPVPGWKETVVAVGVLSALLAACMALVARDLKRVLAFSTVSQLGYMVYAVGVGDIFASQFHLLSHAVFKALLFLGAGAVIHTLGSRDMRQMGGLGGQMPFVRGTFIVGALALAGIPFLNGFWSKELVLEAGLHAGPTWAYWLMLAGAGLTAFYTFRMVWMVFYGAAPPGRQVHDASRPMRLALAPLALGACATWLLAGPFGRSLEHSLPFHRLHVETTLQIMLEVVTAPATLLALAVIAAGLAAWWFREDLAWLSKLLTWPARAAEQGFGFERLDREAVDLTRRAAAALSQLQTGQLNWNLLAIAGGLLFILIVLAWGAA